MTVEMNLGGITSAQTINNFVGNFSGGVDSLDRFAFTLSSTQNLNLSLSGLSADADLRLFHARSFNGDLEPIELIAASTNSGSAAESIDRILGPGVYLVDVVQGTSNASTNYTLGITPNNDASFFNVGTLSGARALSGFVGDTSPSDVYRFSLNSTSNVNLRLAGMSDDADLFLGRDLNRNGRIDNGELIVFSENTLNRAEAIAQILDAGDYLVEVFRYDTANTHYRLQLNATQVSSPLSNVDLVGQFGTIQLPDIRLADSTGNAQLLVANTGLARATGPVTVRLYASTDANFDSNDELLDSQTLSLNLQRGQTQAINFNFDAPTVVAPGSFYLLARLDADQTLTESNESNNLLSLHASAPGTDVVLDWNATLLNAIQAVGSDPNLAVNISAAPPVAARNQAIVHAAIFDAVNAIDRSYSSYLPTLNLSPFQTAGASLVAAAAAAAHQALSVLYPTQQAEFDAQLARSLAEVPDGIAENRGIDIGRFVANAILNSRSNDGVAQAIQTTLNYQTNPYLPGTTPGDFQPIMADGFVLLPTWGQVSRFGGNSNVVIDGPPVYGSAAYANELNQVQALGGRNSIVRTADQSEIATFWAYDRADTFRPPGQWNEIAQTVALQAGNTLVQNARLFAHLNIAQADAGILAWAAKFEHDQLRPVTAIHLANSDGNPQTIADPTWQSYLPTPPFPDYVSGHSTFGAAAAAVLAAYYGDNYQFQMTSQEMPGVYRSYSSFIRAAEDNGISRIYGGVHVQSANRDGLVTGYSVGNLVVSNLLT